MTISLPRLPFLARLRTQMGSSRRGKGGQKVKVASKRKSAAAAAAPAPYIKPPGKFTGPDAPKGEYNYLPASLGDIDGGRLKAGA